MLRENLKQVFNLPSEAIEWLMMVWNIIQVFDDVADGDPIDRSDLNKAIWDSLVGIYQNPFFVAHAHILTPVLATMVLKWHASDIAERNGKHDARSFVWRAGYYDLVLISVQLVHGPDVAASSAHLVMELYGERFENYMKEFGHA